MEEATRGGLILLGFFVFIAIIYGIELMFSMIGYGLLLGLIIGSIVLVAKAIAYIIKLIKYNKIVEAVIIIAIFIIMVLVKIPYIDKFKPFGFEFTYLSIKILELGIIGLAVWIREANNYNIRTEEDISKVCIIIATIAMVICSVFLISKSSFNKTFFVSQNSKMETFWENKRIKKECKDLTAREEMAKIIEKIKEDYPNVEEAKSKFTKDGINEIIEKLGYKKYNGIYCYAFEDDDSDVFLIGLCYGSINGDTSYHENQFKTENIYVSKDTFEILDREYQSNK